jgi:DNA-binding GntR family transcriptional regulator
VLLERTGNPFLVQVIDWLSVHSRRLNTLYFTQDRPTTNSYQDHLEIIAALRDRDEPRARQLARDHILRTIDVVQQPVT